MEIKRFYVAVQRGSGFRITLTAGASRRVWRELTKAHEKYPDAELTFDYFTQEAVIATKGAR